MLEVLQGKMPISQATKAIISLHGRGGTAHEARMLAEALSNGQFFIAAPQAEGNSWYPKSFLVEEKLNEPELSVSIKNIKNLIDEITKQIPKQELYILGFSQGACLALEVALRFAEKYGGVIAFTGGLI